MLSHKVTPSPPLIRLAAITILCSRSSVKMAERKNIKDGSNCTQSYGLISYPDLSPFGDFEMLVPDRGRSGYGTDQGVSRCLSIVLIKALVYSFALIFLFYLFSRGSLNISLSNGWFRIKCHLSIRMFFKHGNDGCNCVTKGKIFFCAFCFSVRAAIQSEVNLWEDFVHQTIGITSRDKACSEIFNVLRMIKLDSRRVCP